MSLWWEEVQVAGESPAPRSGHSFSCVGGRYLLFGGAGRKSGKAQTFNDLYELDIDEGTYKWKEIPAASPPPARARHAAVVLDSNRLLIFGGLDKRTRFNDLWIYDAGNKCWSQPEVEGTAPMPRAHFTATKFFDKIFIFGGYGGSGQVFGDMWVLHVGNGEEPFRWEEVTESLEGTGPAPRFDHCCVLYPLTPNSDTFDKLLIMGGRDLSQMHSGSHQLDLKTMTWDNEEVPPCLPYEIANNICDGIESVPYHKVFSFGGKKGMMDFMNVVEVMDAGTQLWSTPPIETSLSSLQPPAREDATWVYNVKQCEIIMFGGWANRWLGDLWKLNVSAIIGPPYACTGISPQVGAVFGQTELLVEGLRFRDGKCQVSFGSGKNEVIVDAEYVDPTTIKVLTPNFEQFGAMEVPVKVNISGDGWTVNQIKFTYFANTLAKNCIAYGPGLAPTGVFGVDMPFVIQAKDTMGGKRQTGGDVFHVMVVSDDEKYEGTVQVMDGDNGLYNVLYSVPAPGSYKVHVNHTNLGDENPSATRGSPFSVTCQDPWTKHRVVGAPPAMGAGLSLVPMGSDLVVFGGSKAGASVCAIDGPDWRWSAVEVSGEQPPFRMQHSSTLIGKEMVVFGGINLADKSCLNDVWFLRKDGDSWSWQAPAEAKGFTRRPRKKTKAPPAMVEEVPAEDGGGEGGESGEANAAGEEPPAEAEAATDAEGGREEEEAANEPALPLERSCHMAVAIDKDLLVIGGDQDGDILDEICMLDTADKQTAIWMEPIVKGDWPRARKGAAVAATRGKVYMFSGVGLTADEDPVILDDIVLLETEGPMSIRVLEPSEYPTPAAALKPAPRQLATFVEQEPGKLFLYGGATLENKPLNDAWVLDTVKMTWTLVYNGHADLLMGAPCAVGTLVGRKLVCLSPAAGSPKLDQAMSLDFAEVRDSLEMVSKMKADAPRMLDELKDWVNKQKGGLEVVTTLEKGDMSPEKFQDLVQLMDALFQVRENKVQADLQIDQLREALNFLSAHKISTKKWESTLDDIGQIWDEVKKAFPGVKEEAQPFQDQEGQRIRNTILEFSHEVQKYQTQFRKMPFFKYATGFNAVYPIIDEEATKIKQYYVRFEELTGLAQMFDFPEAVETAQATLADVKLVLELVKDVWDTSALCEQQFVSWRETRWSDVQTEMMEDGAKAFVKEVKSLNKKVRDEDCFKGVDQAVKNFLVSVPLVADLRSPAMRDRHWQQLQETTKVQIDVNNPEFKLDDLLKLELHKFEEEVGEIVDRAQKEEKMEQSLTKLDEVWTKVEFVFTQHKDTDVYTVKMAEEDFEALEDNQVVVQGMIANRYMNTFRDQILGWNKKLFNVAEVYQILTEIQRTWAYLESLFIHSDEVKRELPEAAERFVKVDVNIKAILREFKEKKNCVNCCNKEGLFKDLESEQKQLELCEKALADYMESKRRAFPRFYFVSTADLLDILSNGNNPNHVMIHMSKCFQAIDKLRLDQKESTPGTRPTALGMESCVGIEYVAFTSPLPLKGKVEEYMNDIIQKMRQELRVVLKNSVEAYTKKAREQWLFDWSSQIILVVNQIYWCQEVEEAFSAISKGNKDAMAVYNEKQVDQLKTLIGVTRTELAKADRQKVMNMITIDAHSRDMVANIVKSGASEVDSFQWASQLRSYWDTDISDCRIRICDANFPYGYEYLGNGPRLVITPLTDRIYITATQACWLSLGTAPAGPAGTGKTETTKDLSAQLGKSVYVFNCAPEMDYRTMGDIFKGLAASGSWGCFDEFNRLVPEVLSVCSVQYKCVCDSQKRKSLMPGRGLEYVDKQGVKVPAIEGWSFVAADGVEMPLEEGMSAFITMNPGYIGRAELPESLKALFRPITVVVPDRQLIMENMLMAEGFETAKELAKKFAALYYLLEDLLSPQKHYDWGLRAIKSVLVVAGSLLRAEAGQVEADVLFRALRDFNIPKILSQDMVIFMGLLNDLFPGVDPPRKRDYEFEKVIVETTREMGLTAEDDFILRIVQLSELLAIRHCVFLMGPTGSSRTEAYRVLSKAIPKGTDQPVNDYLKMTNRQKILIRDINPKAISTQELYGYVNMATREWKDGLLSFNMRELANMPDTNPKWLLLDGDLDANWIESMNSVMDDNKLLTLPSNERIRLLPHMKLIFEIRDLKYATPATATRAGILYISEARQWDNMVQSWLQRVVRPYAVKAKWKNPEQPIEWLRELFAKYVPDTIFEMKRAYNHLTPLGTMNFVTSLVNTLEGVLKPENINNKAEQSLLEMYFVFAMVWAFGGALAEKDGIQYRKNFDKWWKQTWTTVKFPGKGTVFDYYVNPKSQKFSPWAELVQEVQFDSTKTGMGSLFVPTPESSSLRFFLDLMVAHRKPIMFVGGAGVGKTQLVNGKLQELSEDYLSLKIAFNYFTEVTSFQKILEGPLEKKAGVNYGPPGTKQLVYFVDDLNMPKLDPYETAMPISLMRQHLGWGHWYDRSKLTLKAIHNTLYITCMNPTAGSFLINPRLQRLFLTLAVEFPGQDSLMKIYGTFLAGHLKHFKADVEDMSTKMLQAALALHEQVASTFRKTAINFHYEFTIRHLANVFQGILMSAPEQFNDTSKMARLWLHESERVYADRLVTPADLDAYNKKAIGVAKKYFSIREIDDYYKKNDPKPLIFSHFAGGLGEKVYNEVDDYAGLYKILMEALEEYNETNARMDLVLFEDAMKHVCRISRIISNSAGHALLVGVGGSGKQSLSRLASHICGYQTQMIVISGSYGMNNFKEDLQKMYRKAGLKGEGTMFLFTDSQIVDEKMLVFINDLLASGEIPDLFPAEDKDDIINAMRSETKALGLLDTSENCWATFIKRVKDNLHMVFTASPVGENFRVRSQRFLATINSTVIDWFQPWPESSLHSVAKRFLDDMDLGEDSVRAGVVEFMPYSFSLVNKTSTRFFETERRYNYTTPKTFLELIKLYKNVLSAKREATQQNVDRLESGLQKLQKTKADVDVLVAEAEKMAVEVAAKVQNAEEFAAQVAVEKDKVGEENAAAQVEAEKCEVIAKEVSEKQASCEADLAAAEPLVAQAEAALDTLNKKDLGEAKSLKKPPAGVDDITAVVIIMLEGNPKDKSWSAATKLMNNVDKFLERLKGFKGIVDEGKIQKKVVDATRPYLELPHFNKEAIFTKSRAAAGLCEWAINIVKYFDVVYEVEPKRQELREANEKLEAANEKLSAVQEKVRILNEQVEELERQSKEADDEKNAAIAESERCQRKLGLANRLINALASEGERWAQTVEQLKKDYEVLTGDMLLAAAFVSYSGPFTAKFRAGLVKEWGDFLRQKGTPMTVGLDDPMHVLVDSAIVARWTREGLPSDPTSVQNGAILSNSERWPLLMDPQLQGIVWIKEKESKNNLQVCRMGDDKTVITVERAMEAGHSVLIENMGESIDAVLNPVVTRSTFKKGRSLYVKLGDKEVEYNKDFKLFLHTKLSNPHYPPEIQAETTLINFTVTEVGLEDQLLALVVNKERPDLEETKTQLIIQNTEFTIKLKQLEDDLLYKLSTAEGDLTEDVELIESLEESKRVSDEINEKVAEAKITEVQINENRNKYRTAASRGAMLFFLINSLVKIHAFYAFSLNSFVTVFSRGIDLAPGGRNQPEKVSFRQVQRRLTGEAMPFEEVRELARRSSQGSGSARGSARGSTADKAESRASEAAAGEAAAEEEAAPVELTPEELEERLQQLLDSCTFTVFNVTRRGLFDRDKLIVLSLLTFQILLREEKIDATMYEALCKAQKNPSPPPITDDLSRWMTEGQWSALDCLCAVSGYGSLAKEMEKNSDDWLAWCSNDRPEVAKMPGEWDKLTPFKKLLVIRALRPDRITNALQNFCEGEMGSRYVNQDPFRVEAMIDETTQQTPIFFVLFPGYSPSKEVEQYANQVGKSVENGKLTLISMGQGQEGPAEAVLDKYTKEGGWVFLDNVHLMKSWVPRLERKLEIAAETAHEDFRCFFSAEPINGAPHAKIVPESILQVSIKISNEPPSDLKSNMRRAFAAFTEEQEQRLSTPEKRYAFKAILFGLCFYHSLLLGRKKFGVGIGVGSGSGLGFCRSYSFNMGDLTTCGDVLINYLEAYPYIPWEDLRYMFGEVFYGGHIVDDMDRRCCMTYLEVLIKPEILPGGELVNPDSWSQSTLELAPGFCGPLPRDFDSVRNFIEFDLPAESPVVYGMHPNAELSLLTSQGETLFRTLTDVTGGGGGGGGSGSGENAVRSALQDFMERLPEPFVMVEIEARIVEKTPFVVCALQETGRMNGLLVEMKRSMEELELGLNGALNMSDKMEALARGIASNSVPASWMGQMSTRIQEVYTLTAWYADVLKRYDQLEVWVAGEVVTPVSVWLPGLFNPKAFVTAVMQTYARANKLPLDVMKFMTEVTTKTSDQITEPAPLGAYIHGLCLEGARWDKVDGCLKDSNPNELHPVLPVIQVVPVTVDQYNLTGYYRCPVYTNMQRANVYSAIVGVFTMKTNEPEHKWTLASVALLLQDDLL